MKPLIEEFIHEHEQLLQILSEVKLVGIASTEGKSRIMTCKNLLLSHLEKEDTLLYPPLYKKSETDNILKHKLTMFTSELTEISNFASAFFEKYETGEVGLDYARDFGKLYTDLKIRINQEEALLYSEFEKLDT